jgi:hypothetical protein
MRSWGAPDAPVLRKEFSIMALVLDGSGTIARTGGNRQAVTGLGLAEYYDVDYWPLAKE